MTIQEILDRLYEWQETTNHPCYDDGCACYMVDKLIEDIEDKLAEAQGV